MQSRQVLNIDESNGIPKAQGGVIKVLIVGAGFAGLKCAEELAKNSKVEVTLLERNNYQQFQPLLYQVATAILSPSRAAFNLRSILWKRKNVDVRMVDVASVDLSETTVTSTNGSVFKADYLVLAAGAQPNFFGIEGVEEHALPLYSLLDATRLRSRLIEAFERADEAIARGEAAKVRLAIIGGGATGVEIAGAVADICSEAPRSFYRHLRLGDVELTLVNSKDEVLTGFSDKSKRYAKRALEDRGVRLCLNKQVETLSASEIGFNDGTSMPYGLAIWAGGLKASSLAGCLGSNGGAGGRIDVQNDLAIPDHPRVYALGDFANIRGAGGKMLPQLAAVAQQAGSHCAKNIIAQLTIALRPISSISKGGIMAMVGRNAAVAELGAQRRVITGFLAFVAWLGVHAILLTTFPANIGACLAWAWSYFGGMHVEAILDPSHVTNNE